MGIAVIFKVAAFLSFAAACVFGPSIEPYRVRTIALGLALWALTLLFPIA